MTNTPMNPHILALLRFARQQELKLVGELNSVERNATGTLNSWAAKGVIASIMRWKELQVNSLKRSMRARASNSPLFVIDVRGSEEYSVGHVLGAVNIPFGQLVNQLTRIPQDCCVVTYCNPYVFKHTPRGASAEG